MAQDKNPSLNALRVFAVAAHADSFKQAAQQLGVSQSNITRQIQALEEQLGTRLFQRDNRVHALTAAGEVLAPDLLRIFRELDRVVDRTRSVGDNELTTLRIAVPESFLRWWLSRRLAEFYALYPHIQVQFQTLELFPSSPSQAALCQQLTHEDIDLAIHYGALRDKSLHSAVLYTPTYVPVAQSASEKPLASRLWWVDTQAPYWRQFKKAQAHLARQLTLRTVNSCNMAIDLAQGTDHLTLIDQLFLMHPHLQNYIKHTEYQVSLPDAMVVSYKQRARQPLALVAFHKWLDARLTNSLAGSAQPN